MVELMRRFLWAMAAWMAGGGLLPSGVVQAMWDGWLEGV
jgi:hypothetical protein